MSKFLEFSDKLLQIDKIISLEFLLPNEESDAYWIIIEIENRIENRYEKEVFKNIEKFIERHIYLREHLKVI